MTTALPRGASAFATRREVTAVVALTLVAALLRFSTLDVQSFGIDETFTVAAISDGFGHVFSAVAHTESTPPLYYALAWLWSQVFGAHEVGLRTFSALLGTATVPVAFLCGRELAGVRTGLAAAALVACNPFLNWYSQEARAYALLILVGAISLLLFLRARAQPTGRAIAAWAVVSGLALLTHYFAAFLVWPEAIWLYLATRDRRVVAAGGALLVVQVALLPLVLRQRDNPSFISGQDLAHRIGGTAKQDLLGYYAASVDSRLVVAAAALLVAACVWLLARRTSRDERRAALTPGVLAVCAAGLPIVAAVVGLDFYDARNVVGSLIPLLLVAAIAVAAYRAGWLGAVTLAGLCALFLALVIASATDKTLQREDWRGLAHRLEQGPRPDLLVITPYYGYVALRPYLHGIAPGPVAAPAARARVVAFVDASRLGPLPPRTLPGFRAVRTAHDASTQLQVVVAPRPRRVAVAQLAPRGLGPPPVSVVALGR